jgi:putative ubiquitin-RnfH superfamily antitoxin RatB of RatAB toxin-antitoxin module
MENANINVEVVYATADKQWIIPVSLPKLATVSQALAVSKIDEQCPTIDWCDIKIGIFGKIVKHEHGLKEGDRIEIYRSLPIDPMTRRFQRVAKERKK